MTLDQAICDRARRARDARFDGRFFIAVVTTGIYCRPICPAPAARAKNIRYYPSAAAAAEAGFRPCLRCRPELSPGTPAWLGTSATVSRALRLIGESTLEDGGVDALALKLGIGSRHLRRLFLKHLGATPIAVAQTRRVHFAKKLIDETALPVTDVAMASGFGSVRRFNTVFKKLYGRTPSSLRHVHEGGVEKEYSFQLMYRAPFNWNALLEFLALRATPGVERIEDGSYRRTVALEGHSGTLEVRHDAQGRRITVRVQFPESRLLFLILERVRRIFDLTADPQPVMEHLRQDPMLRPRLARRPGLRVPGCWDGFEVAVRAVLGQQVSVKAATTLAGRLVRECGTPIAGGDELGFLFPRPEQVAEAKLDQICLTTARARALRTLARAVRDGHLHFGPQDLDEFAGRMCELEGIGEWTAHYVAMRALGEPDAFPASDLVLIKSAGVRTPAELSRRADAWRPWRAYAAMYLWQGGTQS